MSTKTLAGIGVLVLILTFCAMITATIYYRQGDFGAGAFIVGLATFFAVALHNELK